MSLITSISGIRGTIGGSLTSGLNPVNIAEFTSAFATYIKRTSPINSNKIVVGRDARISGEMVRGIVVHALAAMGFDVIDLDYATTPTTEMAVVGEQADGGIIVTASHNPRHWNALKLLNHKGEFLSAEAGDEIIKLSQAKAYEYATVEELGKVVKKSYDDYHIEAILNAPGVDANAIKQANLTVVVDCINSVGAIIIPKLLDALGISHYHLLNNDPSGAFSHNPEPLPEHLVDLSKATAEYGAHVGFAVDPDVDRLAIVCEDGKMFGEENTLVTIADYILSLNLGKKATVSNLSSSRALRDITTRHGGTYFAAAVGEVNVVQKMKEVDAVIGGEGNGGIIYPALHYGRDALVGITLFLTIMARRALSPSQLLAEIPAYAMSKKKAELCPQTDVDAILRAVQSAYANEKITTIDGVKIDFSTSWVHLRKSNTEPIIRVYAEAPTASEAEALADELLAFISRSTQQ